MTTVPDRDPRRLRLLMGVLLRSTVLPAAPLGAELDPHGLFQALFGHLLPANAG